METLDSNITDAVVKFVTDGLMKHPKLWVCLILALVLRGMASALLKAYVARKTEAGEKVSSRVKTAQDVLSWNPLPGKYGLLYWFNIPGMVSFGNKKPKPVPPPLPPPPSGEFPGGGAA